MIPFLRRPLAVVVALLGSNATMLRAHNTDVSSTTVQISGDVLAIELDMSAEAAMALLGIPLGTQGTPPDRESILPPLTKVARDVYRFTADGQALEFQQAVVEFREEDGIVFKLTYALPVDPAAELAFDATYLQHLNTYHRAAITLVDAHGGVGPGRMLTMEKPRGTLPFPKS